MTHRWQKERQVSPSVALGAGCPQVPKIPGTGTPGKPQVGRHLEVSVHDAQAVQVGDSAKDLGHQVASILLCVGAALHDSIEQLTPCHPEERPEEMQPPMPGLDNMQSITGTTRKGPVSVRVLPQGKGSGGRGEGSRDKCKLP